MRLIGLLSFFGVCHVSGRLTPVQVASPWIRVKRHYRTDDLGRPRFARLLALYSSKYDSRGPANRLAAGSAKGRESAGLCCPTDATNAEDYPNAIVRPFDQCETHSIALHITKNRVQMAVLLDRK